MEQRIRDNIKRCKFDILSINSKATILQVTKTVDPFFVNIAIEEGLTVLGENRVQEFLDRYERYNSEDIHFIGHLQTNKVKFIIDKVKLIQSVDSFKILSLIDKIAEENNLIMDILLQINIGNEISKSGTSIENVDDLIFEAQRMKNVNLRGLMTIPPKVCDLDLEKHFDKMFEKYSEHKSFDILSMGMSGDYKLALKHGSNMVRIGSGIFRR